MTGVHPLPGAWGLCLSSPAWSSLPCRGSDRALVQRPGGEPVLRRPPGSGPKAAGTLSGRLVSAPICPEQAGISAQRESGPGQRRVQAGPAVLASPHPPTSVHGGCVPPVWGPGHQAPLQEASLAAVTPSPCPRGAPAVATGLGPPLHISSRGEGLTDHSWHPEASLRGGGGPWVPQGLRQHACSGDVLPSGARPGRGLLGGRSLPRWTPGLPALCRLQDDRARDPGAVLVRAILPRWVSVHTAPAVTWWLPRRGEQCPSAQGGGAACCPVESPNGASGAGCSPRCPATPRVEVRPRAAVRSEGGALGGQEGRPGSGPSGMNRRSRFPWGVEGSPGHPPRGPALGPLADHVPVVGDDRVLQLHHRGEDPLHLQRAGEGVSVAGTPGTAPRLPPELDPTPGTTRGLGVLVGMACGQ